MTFRHYVEQLYEFLEQHPEAEDYTAVFSEPNGWYANPVEYPPVVGEFEGGYNGALYIEEPDIKPNAVCIN